MLADEVVTKLFGPHDIRFQGFVGRCSVKAIRPPTLVKQSERKIILVVELYPDDPAGILVR